MNLEKKKMKLIIKVCDEILQNKHNKEFPLVIWQTGSGTQTNKNVNEVISNRANVLSGKSLNDSKYIKANDEINMSQSSNDTFPTVTNIAVTKLVYEKLIPSTESFIKILTKKVKEFSKDIKIGRTHMMDATPISLGQEFSGYESQMKHGLKALKNTLKHLKQLAIGGTAVGTGLNAPDGFDVSVVKNISDCTKINFEIAPTSISDDSYFKIRLNNDIYFGSEEKESFFFISNRIGLADSFDNNLKIISDNIPKKYMEQIIMGIGAYNQNSRSTGQKIYRVGKNNFGGISMFSYTVFKKNPTYAKQIIQYLK